jgi:hypothetical protein
VLLSTLLHAISYKVALLSTLLHAISYRGALLSTLLHAISYHTVLTVNRACFPPTALTG